MIWVAAWTIVAFVADLNAFRHRPDKMLIAENVDTLAKEAALFIVEFDFGIPIAEWERRVTNPAATFQFIDAEQELFDSVLLHWTPIIKF